MESKKTVYYSEFGAVGDGKAEDFFAIKRCHDYANENGCRVKADEGAVYYIGEINGESAIIMTDVDWTDATFIIDDRKIGVQSKSRSAHIFRVLSRNKPKVYGKDSPEVTKINEVGSLPKETTNIGYAPGYPALLVVFDEEHSAYNRWGTHATGRINPQKELIVVDGEGNIDENTAFLLDYKQVTKIEEYRIDDEPLLILGGKFITRANGAPPEYTSYGRGILFERSNVTIRDTFHDITDEGDMGAPYMGFIYYKNLNNLLCENLTLVSHKTYVDYEYENGKIVRVHSHMGSYDIGGFCATNICFKNCVQSNFYKFEEKEIPFIQNERWGIMGTNYCKNMTYDGCILSRLDAHAGVYNINIKNSVMSFIYLTGGGRALIENTRVITPEKEAITFLALRVDYGSTWRGDIIIKDCEFVNAKDTPVTIAYSIWNNWDFGYVTYLPNFTFDNFKLKNPAKIYVYPDLTRGGGEKIDLPVLDSGKINKNPMNIKAPITVKNNTGGYEYIASRGEYLNSKIKINFI